MSDKHHQLSILDQWASGSGQVSRLTDRLSDPQLKSLLSGGDRALFKIKVSA